MKTLFPLVSLLFLSVTLSYGGGPLTLEACREAARSTGRVEEFYALNELDREEKAALDDRDFRFTMSGYAQASYQNESPNPASLTDFPFVLHALPRLQYHSGFLVSQSLYRGGQRRIKAERNDVDHDLNRLEVDRTGIELDGVVDELYLNILLARKRDGILERQLNAVQIKLRDAREAYKEGVSYRNAVLALEAQLSGLEAELSANAAQTASALAMLAALTGLEIDADTELEVPRGDDSSSWTPDPGLQRLDLEARRIGLDKELARASVRPSLQAFGMVGYGQWNLNFFERRPDVYGIVGLTLVIPITAWRDLTHGVARLDAAARKLELERGNLERRKEIALLQYDGEIARYDQLLDANVRTVEKYEALCEELDILSGQGAVPVSDYLTALEQLSAARLDGELYSLLKLQQQLLRKRHISSL